MRGLLTGACVGESADPWSVEREELDLSYHAAVVGWPDDITVREVAGLVEGQRARVHNGTAPCAFVQYENKIDAEIGRGLFSVGILPEPFLPVLPPIRPMIRNSVNSLNMPMPPCIGPNNKEGAPF